LVSDIQYPGIIAFIAFIPVLKSVANHPEIKAALLTLPATCTSGKTFLA
jgi:hypothetical protein